MNVNSIDTSILTGYENLANAIIVAGAEDYRSASKRLLKDPENQKAQDLKRAVERFCRSQWFTALTRIDGEYLLKKLNEELNR